MTLRGPADVSSKKSRSETNTKIMEEINFTA